jgi:hypothetical protein
LSLILVWKISLFNKIDGGTLVMSNGDQVPVASRKRDMLLDLFDNLI